MIDYWRQAGSKPAASGIQPRPATAPQVPRGSRPSALIRNTHRRISHECSQSKCRETSTEIDKGNADPRLLLQAQISLQVRIRKNSGKQHLTSDVTTQRWMDLNSKNFVHFVTVPKTSKPSYSSFDKRAVLRLARIEKDLALSDLWYQDLAKSNAPLKRPWAIDIS